MNIDDNHDNLKYKLFRKWFMELLNMNYHIEQGRK